MSRLRITALDASREALGDWRFLVGQYVNEINREVRPMQVSLDTQVADLERGALRGGKWDVILFGDSLNELFREYRHRHRAARAPRGESTGRVFVKAGASS